MKIIKNFERYLIDENGNIFTKDKPYKTRWEMKPNEDGLYPRKAFLTKDGYKRIELRNRETKKVKKFFIHRLVYTMYHGEIPKGMTIDHIDNDKTNNHYSNLQLLTPKQNSVKANRHKRNALSDEQVLKIREIYATSRITQEKLAKMFGVTRSSIYRIVNRKAYNWI